MERPEREIWGDVRWGIAWGLGCALFLTLVAACNLTFVAPEEAFAEGETVQSVMDGVILAYVAAGVLGGAVIGVSRPWLASRAGAIAIGALVGTVTYGVIGLLVLEPEERWTLMHFLSAAVPGVIVGAIAGWRLGPRSDERRSGVSDRPGNVG